MANLLTHQSKALFRQLADAPGPSGVKTLIENHDAWLNNTAIQSEISVALRHQLTHTPRPTETAQRITNQRRALAVLAIPLPVKLAHSA